MKEMMKRGLSLLVALALCFSLLPQIVLVGSGATVNYNYGSSGSFTNVIKNWGSRGTVATFLSPNAESFYEDNNTSYAELSQLAGASSTSAVPNSALYKALKTLMQSNHTEITSYNDTKGLYRFTDCQNGSDTSISSFYSGKAIGPSWDGAWNREHTWPNSKGLGGSDENDIMMLRPTSMSENSSRGNTAYGKSIGFYNPNSESGGKYNLHGDVARIALYVYVRWGNTSYMWGSSGVMESLSVLLEWMEEDPVDTWELGRNDSVESITGTRNVFVDYPELAFVMFNAEIPATMSTPSGEAANSGNAFSITASANNSSYGSVSVHGKNITATPKIGYYVSGYTVAGGTASVVRDGNVFTVTPETDCHIVVNFAQKASHTATFVEDGETMTRLVVYEGDQLTFPTFANDYPAGYTFLGWIDSTLGMTTTKPSQIYAPGSKITFNADKTYYALYSHLVDNTSVESQQYELHTGELTDGKYLITYGGFAMQASELNKRLDFAEITLVDGMVQKPAADLVWEIVKTGDGYYTIYNALADSYAGGTGVKNNAGLLSEVTDFAKWSHTFSENTHDLLNIGNQNAGVNHILRKYLEYGFACYGDTSGGPLTLYKQMPGVLYFSTTTVATCNHENTVNVAEQKASCQMNGYTAGVFCNDCAVYISGHKLIPAIGHNYVGVVTPATQNDKGFTTYTCGNCDDTYKSDYTDALKDIHNVYFVVPAGVSSVASVKVGTAGVELPSAGVPSGEHDYTFVGWAEARVEDTQQRPTIYPAGEKFTTDANAVLYAVYSYVIGQAGSGEWTLVTDASKLTSGSQVVIASNEKGFVAGAMSGKFLSNITATFSSDKSTIPNLPAGALILTLGGGADAWTLSDSSNQQLKCSSVKNLSWSTGSGTWTISITEGVATIKNTNTSFGRFLYNVQYPRFTTYTSDPTASMLLPQLYMLDEGSGETHFTSLSAPANSVSGAVTGAASATVELQQNGATVYTTTANGAYNFSDVADGTYTMVVSAAGMPSAKTAVTVAGANVVKDVALVSQDSLVTIKNALELEGTIGVHYYVALGEGVSNPTMNAWYPNSEPADIPGTVRPDGRYGYKFDVYAMEMTDVISAIFTVQKDGVTYELDVYEYSVQAYCLKGFQQLPEGDLRDLFAALLNYGGYAQINFGYNVENLANAVLPTYGYSTALNSSAIDADVRQDTAFSGTVKATYTGNALELNEVIRLRYNFTLDASVNAENVYFAYKKAGTNDALTYVKAQLNSTRYSGIIEDIGSYEMSDRFEGYVCELVNGEYVQISDTRSFSASCYAYTVSQQTSADYDNLKNCMKAMMTYGKLAYAMFG